VLQESEESQEEVSKTTPPPPPPPTYELVPAVGKNPAAQDYGRHCKAKGGLGMGKERGEGKSGRGSVSAGVVVIEDDEEEAGTEQADSGTQLSKKQRKKLREQADSEAQLSKKERKKLREKVQRKQKAQRDAGANATAAAGMLKVKRGQGQQYPRYEKALGEAEGWFRRKHQARNFKSQLYGTFIVNSESGRALTSRDSEKI